MKRIVSFFFMLFIYLFTSVEVYSQCAMCRASMENSISENSNNFSASLNTGILYLFVMPYLLIFIIGFLWYRASKRNGKNFRISIRSGRKMS